MAMWTSRLRYQGAGGISRAMFLVRQGASKFPAKFLPIIPPNIVRGNPTVYACDNACVCMSECYVHEWVHAVHIINTILPDTIGPILIELIFYLYMNQAIAQT